MMVKTKENVGDCCISHTKHRSTTMLIVSVSLTIVSLICGAESVTLPVKTFPVFSPQTIAQLSHSKSPAELLNGGNNPNNGQKEAELAMNSMEVFPAKQQSSYSYDESALETDPETVLFDNDDDTAQLQELAKRAPNKWQGLQGGWGKRAPNNWNKLSAAWGKRRIPNNAAWNNLSGMWGKKRAKWNELSGMWGKRAAWRDMSGGWGKKKRSNAPHWNKLRGMWGKRSSAVPFGEAENQPLGDGEQQQTMVQQLEPSQQQQLFQQAFSIAQPNIVGGNEQYPQQSPVSSMMNNNKKDH